MTGMQSPAPHAGHFARAVTDFGDKRPVVARAAIYNTQGLKIIDKGVAIDARLYERLTRHQLRSPLEDSVDSVPAVSGASLREAAQALCSRDRFAAAMVAQLRQPQALFEELSQLPLPRPIAFQLTVLSEMQPALWRHALRSMVAAAWLGERLGGLRHDLRMLAAAGLLHDLGMLHLDPALLRREGQLGREQRRQLYTHPLVGVMLLERHHVYPQELLQAVLEHHEALDGSGYPRGLGSGLSVWGRVLGLSELVTAMIDGGHEAPALRLSLALRMNARRYDPEGARLVLEWLQPLRETLPGPQTADPVLPLRDIDRLLQSWSAAAAAVPVPGPAREAGAQQIAELCEAERQALARSGAAPEQMTMLGEDAGAGEVGAELALIAREAAWQLRGLARHARRRWRLASGESFPAPLQDWFDEVDSVCAKALAA